MEQFNVSRSTVQRIWRNVRVQGIENLYVINVEHKTKGGWEKLLGTLTQKLCYESTSSKEQQSGHLLWH